MLCVRCSRYERKAGIALPEEHHLLRRRRQTIATQPGLAAAPPSVRQPPSAVAPLVVWYAEQEEPWIILTDLPPEEVGVSWYALRFWIELGFKALKSLGWKWDKTRRTDRVSRHWLVLSVATLLALAYGTRVEDAQDRRIAPGNLRAPPKALVPNHRPRTRPATVSVIRHGSKGSWSRVWLREPWPQPKPNFEIMPNRYPPVSPPPPTFGPVRAWGGP